MRVALGTIEIDDAARKAIRKANGDKGAATRGEVKDYLLAKIESDIIPNIGAEPAQAEAPAEQNESALPEPTAAGDSTPSEAPNTPGF